MTVLTMAGLTLPKDGVSREHWTDAEALGVEMLNLAAWLTQRSVYEKPKDQRKGVWIDEAFFLSEVPTGRVLMNRFARDSRKWNVRVLLSSQIPADFLKIQGFVTLLDSVFVGRLDDDDAQADALRLLKVPVGVGYEQVVAALGRRPGAQRGLERDKEPRQFVFGDGAGGVERIRVDFSGPHLEHLRVVMDTTPGSKDARPQDSRTRLESQHAVEQSRPHVATPPEPDEPDFELAAELEVGLAEEQLLDTPLEPRAEGEPVTGELSGEHNGHNGSVGHNGQTAEHGGQRSRAGKSGTGRDAA
jgi:hypothetical protein